MKKKEHILTTLFCLTTLLVFASLLQQNLRLFKFKELSGAVEPTKKPVLTFDACKRGTYQHQAESYLKDNFGFREPLIRLYNQCTWDCFSQSPVIGEQILMGKDRWIYEPWVVDDFYQTRYLAYYGDTTTMARRMRNDAKRLFQLQQILKPYGTYLFVGQLPGKDLVYPEYLPDNPKPELENVPKISPRYFFENEFEHWGIDHVNFEQWFMQLKRDTDLPLFPQTGTHWTNYASLIAADSLIRYMEHLGHVNMANLVIGNPHYEKAQAPDDDLESLMNLMRPLPKPQYPYAEVSTDGDTTADKPKLIVIGDSFWWNIALQIPLSDIFSASPYWYYFSTIYYDEAHNNVGDIDLVDEVLSADFIMLSYSSALQYYLGNGFLNKTILSLCYDPEEIEAGKAKAKAVIESNESWMDKVRNKASQTGLDLDAVLYDEVSYLVDNNLEDYFPELRDSIVTKRSTRVQNYFFGDSLSFITLEIEKTIQEIKSKPEMMEEMRRKAAERGSDLETIIHDDACWIVDHKIGQGILSVPKKDKKSTLKSSNNGIQQ